MLKWSADLEEEEEEEEEKEEEDEDEGGFGASPHVSCHK